MGPLVALQGLDPRPGVLAGYTRRELPARLARPRMRVPALAQHTLATEKLDALLAALSGGFLFALGDFVAQTLGVLGLAQALVPGRAPEMQVDGVARYGLAGMAGSGEVWRVAEPW